MKHPPAVPFRLTVAVTGHRGAGLGDPGAAAAALDNRLPWIAAAARIVPTREATALADAPPALVLLSALTEGTDQIAAACALRHGFALHAVLPFARAEYRQDFTDAVTTMFDTLLAQTARVIELPGTRDTAATAYALAGRAVVEYADVLIAVRDRLPARGAGGTGEVVEHALRRGIPVIHVPSDGGDTVRLIWSGHDPHITHSHHDDITAHPLDDARLAALGLAQPDLREGGHGAWRLSNQQRRLQLP